MTINAKDAKAVTTAYINNVSADHIKRIEDAIRDHAGKGFTYIRYGNGICNADPRVKDCVCQELQEAGFKIRWCGERTHLHISWEEA